MKLIERDYLKELVNVVGTPDIKVITGVRRSGKSKLLDSLREYIEKNILNNNIIYINFNIPTNENLMEYHNLYDYVESKYDSNKKNFILIDEVQMCKDFEKAINGFHAEEKFDIYITGSNAFLLILQIGTLLVIDIGLSNVTGMQLLIPTNRQNVFTITVIIGALSNVIGNSILIPRYKAIGAIISSVIAESLIFIIQYIYLRKELSLKKIFNFMPRCFISSIVMFAIISLCSRNFNPSIKSTIILIVVGILVYGICIIAFKDDLVIEIITKIKNKIKREKEYEK